MTAPTPATTATAVCGACPHPLAAHDSIGLRFCHATIDRAITRGCSCRTS